MNGLDQKLDKEEQLIFDAFSAINVDAERLKRRINAMEYKQIKKRRRFSVAVAAIVIFLVMSTTAYAVVSGGLQEFVTRLNPAFGRYAVEPVELVYTEDQGIRMEVIGFRQFENTVLLYLSMQDISGANRLSEHTWPAFGVEINGQGVPSGSFAHKLDFNPASNTAYLEIRVVSDEDFFATDVLKVVSWHIICNKNNEGLIDGEWRLPIKIDNVAHQVLIWTDIAITAGNIRIEQIYLSPIGIQISGNHEWEWGYAAIFDHPQIEIELENQRHNLSLNGIGGGVNDDEFILFYFIELPIDIESVTAVIINDVRIPLH